MPIEDFVTYEQALALKKLGFKEECLYHYRYSIFSDNYYESADGAYVSDLYKSHNSKSYEKNVICDAPTLAQAQKWLRKEKDYYIEPRLFYDKLHTDCKSSTRGKYWQIEHGKYYFSYEEALSAGITECLKLLENEK